MDPGCRRSDTSIPDDTSTHTYADARRLALEAVATLAYVKKIAADQLLRSAGVPEDLIKHFLKGKDQATGDALTKRQHAAFISCGRRFEDLAMTLVIGDP
jgi:hypothetical protein